jgi:hypothetical protein
VEGYTRRTRIDDSSQIDEVCYDQSAMKLRVSFKSGGSYIYHGVPSELYGDLVAAYSVGKFFAKYVRDQYETERIGV